MRVLLLVDHAEIGELRLGLPEHASSLTILIAPLNSVLVGSRELERRLRSLCGVDADFEWIDTAELLDEVAAEIRPRLIDLPNHLASYRACGRQVSRWLWDRSLGVSRWWWGALAEKNVWRHEAFVDIARLRLVESLVRSRKFDDLWLALRTPCLLRAAASVVKSEQLGVRWLGTGRRTPRPAGFATLREVSRAIYRGISTWWALSLQAILVRVFCRDSKHLLQNAHKVFVTYFPAYDSEEARRGRYVDSYLGQVKMASDDLGHPSVTVVLVAKIGESNLRESLIRLRKFQDAGETVLPLVAMLAPSDVLIATLLWARQIFVGAVLGSLRGVPGHMREFLDCSDEVSRRALSLWRESFFGTSAVEGLFYSRMFSRFFDRCPRASQCIYVAEFLTWERALVAAARRRRPDLETVAFQHATLHPNMLSYFPSCAELRSDKELGARVLPHTIACNGPDPCNFLRAAGHRRLVPVEAIRQRRFDPSSQPHSGEEDERAMRLLVAGTIDLLKTRALLLWVARAFPGIAPEVRIAFRPHPVTSAHRVLSTATLRSWVQAAGVQTNEAATRIRHADIVFSGTSSISVEALAAGKRVAIAFFPDRHSANPLRDFPELYDRIAGPDDLHRLVKRLAHEGIDPPRSAAKSFISRAGYVDSGLTRWKRLLGD